MMDEATEELASLYVLGLLEPEEAARFQARMAGDEELAGLVSRLEAAAAAVAFTVPPRDPPAALRTRLLGEIRPSAITPAPITGSGPRWALAASIAVLAGASALGLLYRHAGMESKKLEARIQSDQSDLTASKFYATELQAKIAEMRSGELARKNTDDALQDQLLSAQKETVALREELESTRREVTSLQTRDALSQIKIATLTSLLQKTPKAVAVVAWDPDQQRGLLKTTNMPTVRPDQDYQLWIIDPGYKQPVSAGIFQAGGEVSPSEFKPVQPIAKAAKFAVSLERKGGAPAPQGPIVMISE